MTVVGFQANLPPLQFRGRKSSDEPLKDLAKKVGVEVNTNLGRHGRSAEIHLPKGVGDVDRRQANGRGGAKGGDGKGGDGYGGPEYEAY
ncbi:MAG: hypothetical protein AB7P76_11585 [Candidatus Melainabacteria bacterium]